MNSFGVMLTNTAVYHDGIENIPAALRLALGVHECYSVRPRLLMWLWAAQNGAACLCRVLPVRGAMIATAAVELSS